MLCIFNLKTKWILIILFELAGHHGRTPLHGVGCGQASWDCWCGNDVSSFRERLGVAFVLLAFSWLTRGFCYRSLVRFRNLFIILFLISRKRRGQAIAVHTFCVLVLRWSAPNYISKLVVLMVWIFTALVIGIPNIIHRKEQYYGNTGYCKQCIFFVLDRPTVFS